MTALERLLAYAKTLRMRDYRAALARWQRDYDELMARKPQEPTE